MSGKLYLVDGMSHLYRAYYAIQGLNNKQGMPTNAVFGFTNMLRKLIVEEKPHYLGVAVDLSGPTVRHEQFKGYKATRRPTPPDLMTQIPYVTRICEVLRVPVLSFAKYEADDVIGTLADQAAAQGLEVVIVTIDKDMFQLVNDRVSVLDTRTMSRLDAAGVTEKMGVPPEKIVDVLSLVGDSSDNIPGAPGIGSKGAPSLIQEFGSLDALLENTDKVSRKAYRESLQQNAEQILISRELVTICTTLPLALDLKDLELCEPDVQATRELFTELEFFTLLDDFLPEPQDTPTTFKIVTQQAEIAAVAQAVSGRRAGFSVIAGEQDTSAGPTGLALSMLTDQAWVFPASTLKSHPMEMSKLLQSVSELVVHDLKPLCLRLDSFGWTAAEKRRDVMLMAYLLYPNHNDFSLVRLATEYLHCRVTDEEDPGLFGGDRQDQLTAQRADLSLKLFEVLKPRIEEEGLEQLLNEIEIPLVAVLASMEELGVKVDCDYLEQMSDSLCAEIDSLTERIYAIAGEEFNINSPRQLATILFERLQLPIVRKTRKAGHYATGVEVLEVLAKDHDIAALILNYRELTKLKSTYLDALPQLVNPRTGRIHTSYNQMVASTGRLSSSNPNLQNIPVKSPLGRKIRRAFVPAAGYQIMAADYSQIELRVMAHLSEDPVLLDAFRKGEDIHERTAHEVFGMNAVMNPGEFRRHAKVINFGIMYGLSAFGLAQSLKIDRKEAQRYIDDYFVRYQGVKGWIDKTLEEVRRTGQVNTLFGRIRQIPEIQSRNWNLRNFGERTAINAPIQGTAADLIKKAMVVIDGQMKRHKMKSRLIMQVHDELVFEVHDSEADAMKQLVTREMEQVVELKIPLQIDIATGPSWFEAK